MRFACSILLIWLSVYAVVVLCEEESSGSETTCGEGDNSTGSERRGSRREESSCDCKAQFITTYRENMRDEWFADAETNIWWMSIIGYVVLWSLALFDLGLLLREKMSKGDANAEMRRSEHLPTMPGLGTRVHIHLRRGRQQMFGVHHTAIYITIAILYSACVDRLLTSIYFAIAGSDDTEECPEVLCEYGEETNEKWGIEIPAYLVAVILVCISFQALAALFRLFDTAHGKKHSYWVEFAGKPPLQYHRLHAMIPLGAFLTLRAAAGFLGHVIGFRWKSIIEKLYNDYYSTSAFLDFYSFVGYWINSWVPHPGIATTVSPRDRRIPLTDTLQPAVAWDWANGKLHASTFPGFRPDSYPQNLTCFYVPDTNGTNAANFANWGSQYWCASDGQENIFTKDGVPLQKAVNALRGWWFKDSVYFDEFGHRLWKMIVYSLMSLAALMFWRFLLEQRSKALKPHAENSEVDFTPTIISTDASTPTESVEMNATESNAVTIHSNELHNDKYNVRMSNVRMSTPRSSTPSTGDFTNTHARLPKELAQSFTTRHLSDEAIIDVLNDSCGLSIGWLIAKFTYWVLYGIAVALADKGAWRGTGIESWPIKFGTLFILLHFMRGWSVSVQRRLKMWYSEPDSSAWGSRYWSGVEEVVTKWAIGYLLFLFVQQEWHYHMSTYNDFAKANVATCLYGTTMFTGTYPEAETLDEIEPMIAQPFFSVVLLTIYRLVIDGDAIEATRYSEWMEQVEAEVAQPKAKHPDSMSRLQNIHEFVRKQAKRGKEADALMKFVIAYSAIQTALFFEVYIDNLVEVMVGCEEHIFFSTKESCESKSDASIAIIQSVLFLLFAVVLTTLLVLVHKYILIPYDLVDREKEEEQEQEEEEVPKNPILEEAELTKDEGAHQVIGPKADGDDVVVPTI